MLIRRCTGVEERSEMIPRIWRADKDRGCWRGTDTRDEYPERALHMGARGSDNKLHSNVDVGARNKNKNPRRYERIISLRALYILLMTSNTLDMSNFCIPAPPHPPPPRALRSPLPFSIIKLACQVWPPFSPKGFVFPGVFRLRTVGQERRFSAYLGKFCGREFSIYQFLQNRVKK